VATWLLGVEPGRGLRLEALKTWRADPELVVAVEYLGMYVVRRTKSENVVMCWSEVAPCELKYSIT